MADHYDTAPTGAESPASSDCDPNERTDARIRAFLASMRPLCGTTGSNTDEYHRGRALIERMAMGVEGYDSPELKLTPAECADVLYFLELSEPLEPRDWWNDPEDAPAPVVGYQFIIGALQDSLRTEGASEETQPSPSLLAGLNERAFLDIVDDQREQLLNVLGSLRCVAQAVQSDAAPDEGEIAGAIELVADQLQRVLDSLEEPNLLRTAQEATTKVEEIRAASDAAVQS